MPEQGSLWKSALPGGLTPAASALNSSIAVDRRLWREDIQGSLIHAAMLGRQGIIPPEAAESIAQGLEGIRRELEAAHAHLERNANPKVLFMDLSQRMGKLLRSKEAVA